MFWHDPENYLKELEYKVELLNALTPHDYRWGSHHAEKDHKDEFGNHIHKGERYYSRKYGRSFTAMFKLSERSMGAFVNCIFKGNSALIRLTQQYWKADRERELEVFKCLWGHMEGHGLE